MVLDFHIKLIQKHTCFLISPCPLPTVETAQPPDKEGAEDVTTEDGGGGEGAKKKKKKKKNGGGGADPDFLHPMTNPTSMFSRWPP